MVGWNVMGGWDKADIPTFSFRVRIFGTNTRMESPTVLWRKNFLPTDFLGS